MSSPLRIDDAVVIVTGNDFGNGEVENALDGQCIPLFVVETAGSIPVNVFEECIEGSCNCEHFIGANRAQLLPCRLAKLIFDESEPVVSNEDRGLLWDGLGTVLAVV